MQISRMKHTDLDQVMDIYKASMEFMKQNGNTIQWPTGFLNRELIETYIEKDGYVVTENDKIVGVFVLSDHEQAYDNINGTWLNDEPYGVIHRVASGGSRTGVGQFILDWCLDKVGNIRIDTHRDNAPMLRLLEKNGYKYCGRVSFENRGERMAFQKTNSEMIKRD